LHHLLALDGTKVIGPLEIDLSSSYGRVSEHPLEPGQIAGMITPGSLTYVQSKLKRLTAGAVPAPVPAARHPARQFAGCLPRERAELAPECIRAGGGQTD